MLQLTLSIVKDLLLLSRSNSASEPRSLSSTSAAMLASSSRRSVTDDMENLGRDSSN